MLRKIKYYVWVVVMIPHLLWAKTLPIQHTQTVLWNKNPIAFAVAVGHRRRLSFSESVILKNKNPALTTDKVTVINNQGSLYITARQPFAPLLMPVWLPKAKISVLIQLSGVPDFLKRPDIEVSLPSAKAHALPADYSTATLNAVQSLRQSAQQFALPRLRTASTMRALDFDARAVVSLYPVRGIVATPVAAWRSQGAYITAVRLANTTRYRLHLAPQFFRGDFQAVAFYRQGKMRDMSHPVVPFSVLTSKGTSTSSTLALLLSSSPFDEARHRAPSFARGAS